MPTFLKGKQLNFTIGEALLVTASSLVVICIAIPFMGALSDRIGRKKVIAGSAIAMAVVGIPAYALIATGEMALAILGACIMAVVFAGHTAVIHILIVELFPTRVRYSAYGLGYNISSALFGGTAPLLMTWLISIHRQHLHARLLRRHHRTGHPRRRQHRQGPGAPAAPRRLTLPFIRAATGAAPLIGEPHDFF